MKAEDINLNFKNKAERQQFRQDVAEQNLIDFLNENADGTGFCTRDDSKYGCLKCQEFFRLLDELSQDRAEEAWNESRITYQNYKPLSFNDWWIRKQEGQ